MNRWDELKLSEKAQLLGIYASKGYTDLASIISHYNSFATGGQMNIDGSEEDEKKKRPDETPVYNFRLQPIVSVADNTRYIKPSLPISKPVLDSQDAKKKREEAVQYMRARRTPDVPVINGKPGHSCINTVTGAYGPQSQVSGNITFAENPLEYGFIEIPASEIQPGDIFQELYKSIPGLLRNRVTGRRNWGADTPTHAVMLDSITPNGQYLFDYSNGSTDSTDEKALMHLVPYLERANEDTTLRGDRAIKEMSTGRVYRYIGIQK